MCTTALAANSAADEPLAYRAGGPLTLDGGLAVGFPTALTTGLSSGLGAGVRFGKTFGFGARASWGSATEYSTDWRVTHSDLRLRATVGVERSFGRGVLGLRIGLGPTWIHEARVRNEGARAGATGDRLATSADLVVPGGDLELTVGLHIAGAWQLSLAAGPSVAIIDGAPHAGWTAQLGIAWRP